MKNQDAVIQEIELLVKRYNRWATQLQAITVILIILAIVSSITIGFLAGEIPSVYIKIMAGVAALSTSLLASLRLTKKAQDLREGYRYLQHAVYKFKAVQEYTIADLIDAFQAAEKMVGHVEVEETPALTEFRKKSGG